MSPRTYRKCGLLLCLLAFAPCVPEAAAAVHQSVALNMDELAVCISNLAQTVTSVVARPNGTNLNETMADVVTSFVNSCLHISVQPARALRIMVPNTAMLPLLERHAAMFYEATGIRVALTPVNFFELGAEARQQLASNMTQFSDGWVMDPSAMGEISALNGFKSLDEYIPDDPDIQWLDFSRFFRQSSAIYDGKVVSIPLDGDLFLVYYRRDLFDAYNLTVPLTWEEFVELAERMNGTDTDGNGEPDLYGVCFDNLPPVCKANFLIIAMAAPYIQYQGTQQGMFFDPATMQPLVDNDAMARALSHYVRLFHLQPRQHAACSASNFWFRTGRCLMTVNWGDEFKANAFIAANDSWSTRGWRLGVAQLPGATVVLDRAAGQLVPCVNMTMCPYAQYVKLANGTTSLVNFAPYSAFGGWQGTVSSIAPPAYQRLAYRFYAHVAKPEHSWTDVLNPGSTIDPYRLSQMQPQGEGYQRWVDAGYDMNATQAYLRAVSEAVSSGNVVLDNRLQYVETPYRLLYESALHDLTWNAVPNVNVASTARSLQQQVVAKLAHTGSVDSMRQQYCKLIGCRATPLQAPLVAPTTAPTKEDKSPTPTGVVAAAVASSFMAALAAVALVAVLLRRAAQHRYLMARGVKPPGPGPGTTLMVTDIESSTTLWELLPEESMAKAVEVHHGVVRAALGRFSGYESATEGDSFICAFHSASDAVACAVHIQQELLVAPWPLELLACKHTAAVQEVALTPTSRVTDIMAMLLGDARTPAFPIPAKQSSTVQTYSQQLPTATVEQPPQPQRRQQVFRPRAPCWSYGGKPAVRKESDDPPPLPLVLSAEAAPLAPQPSPSPALLALMGTLPSAPLLLPPMPSRPPLEASVPSANARLLGSSTPDPDGGILIGSSPQREAALDSRAGSCASWGVGCGTGIGGIENGKGSAPLEPAEVGLQLCDAGPSSLRSLDGASGVVAAGAAAATVPGARMQGGGLLAAGEGSYASPPEDVKFTEDQRPPVPGPKDSTTTATATAAAAGATSVTPLRTGSSTARVVPTFAHESGDTLPFSFERRSARSEMSGLLAAVGLRGMFGANGEVLPAAARDASAAPLGLCLMDYIRATWQLPPDTSGGSPLCTPGSPLYCQSTPASDVNAAQCAANDTPTATGSLPQMTGPWPAPQAPAKPHDPSRLSTVSQALRRLMKSPLRETAAISTPRKSLDGPQPMLSAATAGGGGGMSAAASAGGTAGGFTRPAVLIFRGLRVRMGLATGVPLASDVSYVSGEARMHYSGACMRLARAVEGAAAGGQVLIGDCTFAALRTDTAGAAAAASAVGTAVVLHMGQHALAEGNEELPPQQVYQALPQRLIGRLAVLPPLRVRSTLCTGVLGAPVGCAAVMFLHAVGAESLIAWDPVVSRQALALLQEAFEAEVMRINQAGACGYIVEATGGLLLAAFADPAQAVACCLATVEALPGLPWPEALLENVLCEELSVAGLDAKGALVQRVLFRGLRIKAGLDFGSVRTSVNAATGRLAYRGRVMNRAARVAGRATSGQVLCSRDLWQAAAPAAALLPSPITAISLGTASLKGVPEPVELMVCRLAQSSGIDVVTGQKGSAPGMARLAVARELPGDGGTCGVPPELDGCEIPR